MKLVTRMGVLATLLCLLCIPMAWAQSAAVSGTVTDREDSQPLSGATVELVAGNNTVQGTVTDVDGVYSLTQVPAGSYTIRVRFLGYQEFTQAVSLTSSEARTINVLLTQEGFELNTVVVTAGRQAEKVLDAPASISVLDARDIERDVSMSAVSVLRNTTGVDMAQTGVDRREVVLRGFNNAFSGATYILTDYRQAAVASLGVNIHSIMPNMPLDIERVEVVRGPGSSLYGAGVDAGVIHYITKDPFTSPGTSASITGGARSSIGVQFRHAGVVNDDIGYKITGNYAEANDWPLFYEQPEDAVQLAGDARKRDYDYQKYNVNGLVQYRMDEKTTLSVNAGYSRLSGIVLSGIGTLAAQDFGYTYGQVRLQSGNFFAQAYINKNDAGDSFVYDTDLDIVDNGVLYNAQAQYNFSLLNGRTRVISGVDLELTRPDTEGLILGRNEEDDEISEYGAYLQSTTAISDKIDLTLAARGDYNNIVEDFQVSPRAAFVFKPAPGHTARVSYNRAFSSPGSNSNFLDIVARQPDATLPITIRGRGSAFGYTWERNSAYTAIAGTDLVASSLNPAALGARHPIGLDLSSTYAAVHAGLAAIPTADLLGILAANGVVIDAATAGFLVDQLSPANTTVAGFSQGVMGILNLTTLGIDLIDDLSDIDPLKQTTSQTFELGYKGVVNDRILLSADFYYTQKKNFIGPLLMETPMVLVPSLAADLQSALAAGIGNNALLTGSLGLLGLTPEAVAGLLVGVAGGDLPSASTPVAVVQTVENALPAGSAPELMLAYRNFGNVDYWGIDASVEVLATEELRVFGNISIVSDDFFDASELDEDNENLSLALNAPKFKFKGGASYDFPSGLSLNLSGQYVDEFDVSSGPYQGLLESYALIDLGIGYDLSDMAPGLRLDVMGQNILNNKHRQFIGAPEMGRMIFARATYNF